MADVRLVTFNGESVSPQDDAILYQTATVDGVYSNASFTIADATTIHIGGSFAIMGGRFIEISSQDINIPLSTQANDLVGQLYLKIDLSNTDAPLDLLSETANSVSDLTAMSTDEDLNVDNGIYMMRLCLFGVSTTTIYNLDDNNSSVLPVVANILPKNANFTNANIATIESENISSNNYSVGNLLVFNSKLYKALTSINVGDSLVVDENITETTISSTFVLKQGTQTYDITGTTFKVGDIEFSVEVVSDTSVSSVQSFNNQLAFQTLEMPLSVSEEEPIEEEIIEEPIEENEEE